MKHTKINLELAVDSSFYIRPMSDLHYDSPHCDKKQLDYDLREANELEAWVYLNGDTVSALLPSDFKRFRNSATPEYARACDDILNRTKDEVVKLVKKYPRIKWAGIGYGNHEVSVLKHHHYDIIKEICKETGVPRCGYSGWINFKVVRKGSNSSKIFTLMYHHGFPTGEVNNGMPWAERWSSKKGSWDIFVYGHNHGCIHKPVPFSDLGWDGWEHYVDRRIINAGTYEKMEPLDEDEIGSYPEMKGKSMSYIGSSVVKVTLRRDKSKGRDLLRFERKVIT
jgi:hypothetical protein